MQKKSLETFFYSIGGVVAMGVIVTLSYFVLRDLVFRPPESST